MSNFKHLMVAVLAGAFVFSSCSVEKRVHMAGYNVKFNKSYKGADDVKEITNEFEENNVAEAKTSKFKMKNNTSSEMIEMNEVAQIAPVVSVEEVKAPVKSSKLTLKSAINEAKEVKVASEDMATDNFSAKKEQKSAKASSSKDDTVKLIIALILCFFLPPLAVWLAYGSGSETKLNLLFFLGGLALVILGVIMLFVSPFLGLALYVLGALALLVGFIHSLIKVIQKLVG